MRVPLSWLFEFVDVDVPVPELAERLSVSSAEVQAIEHVGVPDDDGNLDLFRIGRVVEAEKHPNADRLQLCRVDVGEGEPRQIVCGAWNFGAGATVAVALPGARLSTGQRLERAKLRGAVSDGMILSEQELELGTDHSGILVFQEAHEPGTPLTDLLPLRETVLALETTGNRPDLLSVYGIAREVSALFDVPLAPPPGSDPDPDADEPVDVRIDDSEGCPRYIGRLFRDVRIGPSPPFLRARLHAAGMRAISNVVDVTNYVMHELGNPLHAFDHAKLAGGRIVVRRAHAGEKLTTLDGVERELDERDLMIADAERSVALAGIMGGEESEVTPETTTVLLEAANFEPTGLHASSERLKLRTEGSNRWEKGVDPYLAGQAAVRATSLLVELAGARWTGHVDEQGGLPERPVVRYRPERADALIGLPTGQREQQRLLTAFGFDVEDDWTVTVPTWRIRDVTREADVIEEVARVRLAEVPFTLPVRRAMFGRLHPEQRVRRVVEDALVGCGFAEAYMPSLAPSDPAAEALRLPDPTTLEQAVLRTTLLPSLISVAGRNRAVGNENVAVFEVARVYLNGGEQLPTERRRVAGLVEGGFPYAKGAVQAIYDALAIPLRVEAADGGPSFHPGKGARASAGVLGELHPTALEGEWGAFELDLDELAAEAPEAIRYEDVVTYPAVKQDLAFVVPEGVPADALVDTAREAAGPELREMAVFDVYPGVKLGRPGEKSIAFSVAFQSPERTLSDEDATALRRKIVAALTERFGAELRA